MTNLVRFFGLFILGMTIFSCQRSNSNLEKESKNWSAIRISFGNQDLTVYQQSDSIVFTKWDDRDSLTNHNIRIPINHQKEEAQISPSEKDSIFKWTSKLINHPITPSNFCTDYVGSLRLSLEITNQVKQSCIYSSICEWETLSYETESLKKLLKQKLRTIE